VGLIILAGGGTGGHVYPALAIGDALRARGYTVHYHGAADRLEGRVAPERGYVFRAVVAPQYPRAGLLEKLKFLILLLKAVVAARAQLKEERPTLVMGVGGYIMAPTVLAAWTLGIPTAVHEANVAPGLANQLCARVAKLVLLTYAETAKKLKTTAEIHTVGCPVNPRILQGDRLSAAERYGLDSTRPVLLVVGGSLGAATLNALAMACAKDPARSYQLVHITGPRYYEEIRAAYGTVPAGVAVVGYEDRISDAYALASLVLCRAGSSTLAELSALGKASVLVPSPNVTDNHQEANARGLEQVGAALVLLEKGLEMEKAVSLIRETMTSASTLIAMAEAAGRLGRLGVAEAVAELLRLRFLGK
jgi:UDP-N-acetylglucosamine--N-acetylmuramyl-(pentapeptide) pyrophosphoryl-undecaprenol N-acetylglucosamine transferase